MAVNLKTPHEVQRLIAQQARSLRLELNLSQQTLSAMSGVSYGSLKKFEQTGQISLESLLKLSLSLGCLNHAELLFAQKPSIQALTLDSLMAEKNRKRGRK